MPRFKPRFIIAAVAVLLVVAGIFVAQYIRDKPSLDRAEVIAIIRSEVDRPISDITARYAGNGKWDGYFSFEGSISPSDTHYWYYLEETRTFESK
jgi:hypothetical protein